MRTLRVLRLRIPSSQFESTHTQIIHVGPDNCGAKSPLEMFAPRGRSDFAAGADPDSWHNPEIAFRMLSFAIAKFTTDRINMVPAQLGPSNRISVRRAVLVLTWFLAICLMLNALYFVLRVSSPVIQQDSWYFLDVFLRKAIDGTLGFGDFFVKRSDFDHAQPLQKLVLLIEWRYFSLDFVVEAVVGIAAAAGCAVVLYRLAVAKASHDRGYVLQCLAWLVICALLFTLNAQGSVWRWPLVALGNLSSLIILVYVVVAWQMWQRQRHVLLAVATLILGVVSDDGAFIATLATILALLLMRFRAGEPGRPVWKAIAVIVMSMVVVRIGYQYGPVIGGSTSTGTLSQLGATTGILFDHFRGGGWWKWWGVPFALSVFDKVVFDPAAGWLWTTVDVLMLSFLVFAHILFWRRAFVGQHDQSTFVAVCLMLVSYAWIAGIIVGRVSTFGNDYLYQPRYVLLYIWQLIALLLMWAASFQFPQKPQRGSFAVPSLLSVVGCLVLLVVQIPSSVSSWAVRPYQWIYDVNMAQQIDALAKDPAHVIDCVPELPVCQMSLEKRKDLTQFLVKGRLNVFSPWVQRQNNYLPKLSPNSTTTRSGDGDESRAIGTSSD